MNGQLLVNESLSKYTSWRVGGLAEQMYLPAGRQDLIDFLQQLPNNSPIFWLGLGSNLLVGDGGITGTVINTRGRLKQMQCTEDGKVLVEVGVACPHVARFCMEQGLVGAEFLAGIPGTMGGALKMNAGAFGTETWDIVAHVEMINSIGQVNWCDPSSFEIGYRSVKGVDNEWFLAVELQLQSGDSELSQQKIKQLLAQRAMTQPTNKATCGSVFKNPNRDYAARLIEISGLKGYCIGDACVSDKHANFIENRGGATAKDIEQLIHYIQQQVLNQQGVNLHTEVCKVGEFL